MYYLFANAAALYRIEPKSIFIGFSKSKLVGNTKDCKGYENFFHKIISVWIHGFCIIFILIVILLVPFYNFVNCENTCPLRHLAGSFKNSSEIVRNAT